MIVCKLAVKPNKDGSYSTVPWKTADAILRVQLTHDDLIGLIVQLGALLSTKHGANFTLKGEDGVPYLNIVSYGRN